MLTNLYPPHFLGGYELICQETASGLAARGHEVAVLCGSPRMEGVGTDPEEESKGIWRDLELYISTPNLASGAVMARAHAPRLGRWLEIERHNQAALARALDRFQPQVVSVWHMAMVSLGLLTTLAEKGVPLVYVVGDDWLTYEVSQQSWARFFSAFKPVGPALGRTVRARTGVTTTLGDVGASGAFLFVSDFIRQRAISHAPWRFPRSGVVYNGVDPSLFRPRSSGSEKEWGWRLLYSGRLDHRKGIVTAIRSLLAMPPEATLLVVGRGGAEERARLEATAEALGLGGRVQFSETDRPGMAALYRQADGVVFPSEWEEPFGLVPVEAMSSGVPVIATGTGGSGEFLHHDWNCLRFGPGDASGLAAQARRLAGDEDLRRRLVANGRTTAGCLTIESMIDDMESWHLAAAAGFASGVPAERFPHGVPADSTRGDRAPDESRSPRRP